MKLTDFFTGEKSKIDTTSKSQNHSAISSAVMNRQIRSLVPGQTIRGELISREGNEVQIKLSEDLTIKARLEQNMNLEVGKSITFEVKNNGSSLVLNPLYTNVATDANVLKALEMANLPVTQDTIGMTEEMMQAGLSIDRASLQQVFREHNQFGHASVEDILDLHKLDMTVNEGNLSQVASYKNLTHQLVNGLSNCIGALSDVIQNMVQNGDVAGAEKIYQELFRMMQEVASETPDPNLIQFSEENIPAMVHTQDGELFLLPVAGQTEGKLLNFPGDGALLQELLSPENRQLLTSYLQGTENTDPMLLLHEAANKLLQETSHEAGDHTLPVISQNRENTGLQFLPNAEDAVNQTTANSDKVILKQVLSDMLLNNPKQWQSLFSKMDQNEKQHILFAKLSDYIHQNLNKTWTIKPEEVADAKQVSGLYDRLDKQLKSLAQVLENTNQTNSNAYRATTNLIQNLDFLQQLNQAYTFVQLPLRLQQGDNAHGELFVYTNKKHLAAKEGEISALLHLDMEHLGPVDVYVAMQNERVNTKFYVKDDSMLDFLEAHMDLLTERLQARGYQMSVHLQTLEEEEEPKNAIRQILQADGHVPVAQYAFDVRT